MTLTKPSPSASSGVGRAGALGADVEVLRVRRALEQARRLDHHGGLVALERDHAGAGDAGLVQGAEVGLVAAALARPRRPTWRAAGKAAAASATVGSANALRKVCSSGSRFCQRPEDDDIGGDSEPLPVVQVDAPVASAFVWVGEGPGGAGGSPSRRAAGPRAIRQSFGRRARIGSLARHDRALEGCVATEIAGGTRQTNRDPAGSRTLPMGRLRLVITAAAAVALLLGPVGSAAAHDVLVGSTPAADGTVDTAPASVSLEFSDAPQSLGTAGGGHRPGRNGGHRRGHRRSQAAPSPSSWPAGCPPAPTPSSGG